MVEELTEQHLCCLRFSADMPRNQSAEKIRWAALVALHKTLILEDAPQDRIEISGDLEARGWATLEIKKEYLEHRGNQCPACNATDQIEADSPNFEGGNVIPAFCRH